MSVYEENLKSVGIVRVRIFCSFQSMNIRITSVVTFWCLTSFLGVI